MAHRIKRMYGKEAAELFISVQRSGTNQAEFEKAVDNFIDRYGQHKYFVGFVGSAAVASAKEYGASVLRGDPDTLFGHVPEELAANLAKRNEKLRNEIRMIGGVGELVQVAKKPSAFLDNVLSEDPTRFNNAMETIMKGGLKEEGIRAVMEMLLYRYYECSEERAPKYEIGISTINTVLAGEHQDLSYTLAREKTKRS